MGVLPQPIDRPPTSARQARPSASDQRRVVLDEYFHAVSRDRERTAAAGRSRRCRVRGVDHWGRDARRPRPAAEWVFCATHGPGHVSCQRRADPQATRRSSRSASRRRSRASSERFLSAARKQLLRLFPVLPKRPGHRKRGERLSDAIEALGGVFAHDSPGSQANLLLVDSTPIESARSVETTRAQPARRRRLRLPRKPTAATSGTFGCTRCSRWRRYHALNLTSAEASTCEFCLASRAQHASDTDTDYAVKISFRCLNLPKRVAPRPRGFTRRLQDCTNVVSTAKALSAADMKI